MNPINGHEVLDYMMDTWTQFYYSTANRFQLEFNGLGWVRLRKRAGAESIDLLWKDKDMEQNVDNGVYELNKRLAEWKR